jgi:hypothetical protein
MNKIIIFLMLVSVCFVTTKAQSQTNLRRMADQVSTAFSLGNMKSLDSKRLRRGQIAVTVENSGGEVEFEYYRFSSFAAVDRWLKKHEIDDLPEKIGWPLVGCKKGTCEFFQDGGISHNHLYLTKVTYGHRNNRLYVTGIQLLAG